MNGLTSVAAAVSSRLGRETRLIRAARPLYERALDFLCAESGFPVRVGGETLRFCHRVRRFAQVESDVCEFLRNHVPPGATVLDVGAYLGIYAMLAARWAGEGGRVIAFEPTADSLSLLQRHLLMNALAHRVRALGCAVGARAGWAELHEHADAYLNSVGGKDPSAAASRRVQTPVLSLDEVCAGFDLRPDLIRIDVQGWEAEVLQGARQTIQRCPELKIVVEVHPQLWAAQDTMDAARFAVLLRDLGLRATDLHGGPPTYGPDHHLLLRPALAAT